MAACWTEVAPPPMIAPTHATDRAPVRVVERGGTYEHVAGAWRGHGWETETENKFEIDFVFEPSANLGMPIGTFAYVDCHGILAREAELPDGTLVMRAEASKGSGCGGRDGTFHVPSRPDANDMVVWKWFAPDTGEEGALGAIHRRH